MEAYPNWQRTHVQTVCVESSNLFASTKQSLRYAKGRANELKIRWLHVRIELGGPK